MVRRAQFGMFVSKIFNQRCALGVVHASRPSSRGDILARLLLGARLLLSSTIKRHQIRRHASESLARRNLRPRTTVVLSLSPPRRVRAIAGSPPSVLSRPVPRHSSRRPRLSSIGTAGFLSIARLAVRTAAAFTLVSLDRVIAAPRTRAPFVVEDTSSPRSLGRSPGASSVVVAVDPFACSSGSSSDSRVSFASSSSPPSSSAPVVLSAADDASTHRPMRDDLHLHPWIFLHTTQRTVCPMYTRHTARDLDRARPVDIALARSTSSRRLVVVSRVVDGGGDDDDGALGAAPRTRARAEGEDDVGRDRARDARAGRGGDDRGRAREGRGRARDARVGCETVVNVARVERRAIGGGARGGRVRLGPGSGARTRRRPAPAEASGDGASSSSMGLDAGRELKGLMMFCAPLLASISSRLC